MGCFSRCSEGELIMHEVTIQLDQITLNELLTVDMHSEIISIRDPNAAKPHKLIESREVFFSKQGLFADVEDHGITIITNKDAQTFTLDDFLRQLNDYRDSCVLLIEGYAGCGKSTLVQYILWKQLGTNHYNYSFYNYDLEAQYDLIKKKSANRQKIDNAIYEAIRKSFFKQFTIEIVDNRQVFNDFCDLLVCCEDFQQFNDLYYKFYATDTFKEIKKFVAEDVIKHKDIIETNLIKQAREIHNSNCILAMDYLFRLALYKNTPNPQLALYICYDNLDAIEDANDLKDFDDELTDFREKIDGYIRILEEKDFFNGLVAPHFIIMATYRKITANMVGLSNSVYKEVSRDMRAGIAQPHVFHIDATSVFSYRNIVSKRQEYFENYLSSVRSISQEKRNSILDAFRSWNDLNCKLEIMKDKYASLWNKNFRTCSLIAKILYSDVRYDFLRSVELIANSHINDGYDWSYYGGSAILLSSVCKVLNDNHIWDDALNLTSLTKLTPNSYDKVSFSRLILTYIYNLNRPVRLEELYNTFCKNHLFSYEELCRILSKMLARNPDGVWRRPIYYAEDHIFSESASVIESALLRACHSFEKGSRPSRSYAFIPCDSGKAYIDRLMTEFEFFSNRLSNSNKALYLYTDINQVLTIIDNVYKAVENCSKNMLLFREEYIRRNAVKEEDYEALRIHPRTTHSRSSQLHTERIIFSHIAYLNNVREFFINSVAADFVKQKRYNELFVTRISNYLDLYNTSIHPISSQRSEVHDGLRRIVDKIQKAISNNSDDAQVLFQSISLNGSKST